MRIPMQLRMSHTLRIAFAAASMYLAVTTGVSYAGYYYVNDCSYYGNSAPDFRPSSTAAHLSPSNECLVSSGAASRSLEINEEGGAVHHGYGAEWSTTTPSPLIQIVSINTPVNLVLVDCALKADGFTAEYFWGAGGQKYGTQSISYVNGCAGGVGYADGISRAIQPSRYAGWDIGCWLETVCQSKTSSERLLAINGIRLEAQESTGPSLLAAPATNLYYHSGWVRGVWPLTLYASDPSGVCTMATIIDGLTVSSWADPSPDHSAWTQCHGSALPGSLDTTKYADGHHSLSYAASNSAVVASTVTRTDASRNPVLIDNAPVGVSLSGPADALSTAGTQYVTATASAGPSGVAGIACTIDGSPYQWHAGASAALPVQGLGQHRVTCYAQNNSVNVDGAAATSAPQGWTITIRRPTELGIGFTRLVDALRCGRVRVRVRIPGAWVTVQRKHRRVRVRRPARYRTTTVMRCHPRTARRRVVVWKTVTRHGQKVRVKMIETEHVVLPPHWVSSTTQRLAFGAGATINGWLGTSDGTALAGQPVSILAAPDDGRQTFAPIAQVTTRTDGSWTVRLPAGPSRRIEASYGGRADAEPAISGQVQTSVLARVVLKIRPSRTHWGGQIKISGRLLGGYVPVGGELVVLWIGWPGGSTEIGHLYAGANGRFSSPYTFLRGNGTETYKLWAATARESDYPFAPARSPAVAVTVAG